MELEEWLKIAEARLAAAGIDTPRLDAQMLAAYIFGAERAWLLTRPKHEIPEGAGEALLQRRESREPLPYILGWREFYGRRFAVNPTVLIPRQETELLIEEAMRILSQPSADNDDPWVLDLGTGSGCIAITLKLERPELEVTASEVSPRALDTARQNAEQLGATIRWVQSDLFAQLEGPFDLIVTNPPYIPHGEGLMPEVAHFEPAVALRAGELGLNFYKTLSQQAQAYLNAGGWLLAEIGAGQDEAVTQMFANAGWEEVACRPDLSGIPRVVRARAPTRHNLGR
ncbi:MAG: peptide chain release factor N(5)-glutamine methyltransferase [Fimbriimonadaceae bacterium]